MPTNDGLPNSTIGTTDSGAKSLIVASPLPSSSLSVRTVGQEIHCVSGFEALRPAEEAFHPTPSYQASASSAQNQVNDDSVASSSGTPMTAGTLPSAACRPSPNSTALRPLSRYRLS